VRSAGRLGARHGRSGPARGGLRRDRVRERLDLAAEGLVRGQAPPDLLADVEPGVETLARDPGPPLPGLSTTVLLAQHPESTPPVVGPPGGSLAGRGFGCPQSYPHVWIRRKRPPRRRGARLPRGDPAAPPRAALWKTSSGASWRAVPARGDLPCRRTPGRCQALSGALKRITCHEYSLDISIGYRKPFKETERNLRRGRISAWRMPRPALRCPVIRR
jgi:hypothetical protein